MESLFAEAYVVTTDGQLLMVYVLDELLSLILHNRQFADNQGNRAATAVCARPQLSEETEGFPVTAAYYGFITTDCLLPIRNTRLRTLLTTISSFYMTTAGIS